jgi:hypothetical protein
MQHAAYCGAKSLVKIEHFYQDSVEGMAATNSSIQATAQKPSLKDVIAK